MAEASLRRRASLSAGWMPGSTANRMDRRSAAPTFTMPQLRGGPDHPVPRQNCEKFPCRHIPLNDEGFALDRYYRLGTLEEAAVPTRLKNHSLARSVHSSRKGVEDFDRELELTSAARQLKPSHIPEK